MMQREERFVYTFILLAAVLYAASKGAFTTGNGNAHDPVKCSANAVQSKIAEYEKRDDKDAALRLYPKLASLLEHEREGTVCDSNNRPIFATASNLRQAFYLYLHCGEKKEAKRVVKERITFLEKKLLKTRAPADAQEHAAWTTMLHANFPHAEAMELLHEVDMGATAKGPKEEQ